MSELLDSSASGAAREIAAGRLSSAELVDACIERIGNSGLNAVVVPRFDQARREAEAADATRSRGDVLGPLHGVPITVKECFYVAGTPACIGLTQLANDIASEDGPPVQAMRDAGAIIIGKTNVPQLMFWHGCENPVYGRTLHPDDPDRTPGGSTGGEGAVLASRGSMLGLGNDLGGSIRIPCHYCGVHGIKPTSGRLPRTGSVRTLVGMDAIQFQHGPMARHVEDLETGLRVLFERTRLPYGTGGPRPPLARSADVDVTRLRIAVWTDDGYFKASPAIRRAVTEAAEILRSAGATVEPFSPTNVRDAIRLYYSILGADGAAWMRRLLRGSVWHPTFRRLLLIARLPMMARRSIHQALRMSGQHRAAELVVNARPRTADEYWRLTDAVDQYRFDFMRAIEDAAFDAWICPPHALPAPQHEFAPELIPPASYCFLANLLGVPAGVVAATRTKHGEESDREATRDRIDSLAAEVEKGSAGLPVGVQVAARHWREDVVIAVMRALEEAFSRRDDYPLRKNAAPAPA